jgi:dienelactone hydrolase
VSFRKFDPVTLLLTALRAVLKWPRGSKRLKTYQILPSVADPAVTKYTDPNLVIFDRKITAFAPLAVFLPGTDGKPRNVRALLRVVAKQGYRAIALKYNDTPAVDQVCPKDPDVGCAVAFRRMRVYGVGPSRYINNSVAESIVGRLTSLLKELDRRHPSENWSGYLRDGGPNWERIVVSGISQGAGMAAYIAKTNGVARVVLFSGPWDVAGPRRSPAPWLSMSSVTPPERWFAGYSSHEKKARTIARAFDALAVPPDHIELFDLDLPALPPGATKEYSHHAITVRDERYAPKWQTLFGLAQQWLESGG